MTPDSSALSPDFFDRDPVLVARELLGAVLVHATPAGILSGRVVEAEAYDCPRDPACTAGRFHASRSADMAVAPGQWIFWATHGHPLLQVSCRAEGISASVLLRALEPQEGVPHMLQNRPVTREKDLTNGPAKLVYALGLDPAVVGHTTVDSPELYLLPPKQPLPDDEILVTSRIGLKAGKEHPWRFVLRGNPWVSPGVPSMEI